MALKWTPGRWRVRRRLNVVRNDGSYVWAITHPNLADGYPFTCWRDSFAEAIAHTSNDH